MSDLIQVPISALSELLFSIKEIACENHEHDQHEVFAGLDGGQEIYETKFSRWAHGDVSYVADFEGKQLKVAFDWAADASNKSSYKDSFDFDVDFAVEPNVEQNFYLVDENGDEVDASLDEVERDAAGFEDFREAAKLLLPVCEEREWLEEVGVGVMKIEDIEEFLVERDDAVDLKFKGRVLGFASSKSTYQDGGRWFELTLYQTVGGKYVCQKEDVTRWQGERNRYSAKVVDTLDEVKEFFGNGWVSKELYDAAGIDNFEFIE